MKHRPGRQARRAGIALAAAVAFAALGTGTAQAAQFTRADITLDSAGNLTCGFRETGLGALSLVTYDCGALALGVVSGCFVRNKFVGPTSLAVFHNVTAEESVALLAKNNGTVNSTITVEAPESHGGGETCTEPAESQPIAVRWCNASLVDMTNGIVGATASELFAQVARTGTAVVVVPACADLISMSPTNGGE